MYNLDSLDLEQLRLLLRRVYNDKERLSARVRKLEARLAALEAQKE